MTQGCAARLCDAAAPDDVAVLVLRFADTEEAPPP